MPRVPWEQSYVLSGVFDDTTVHGIRRAFVPTRIRTPRMVKVESRYGSKKNELMALVPQGGAYPLDGSCTADIWTILRFDDLENEGMDRTDRHTIMDVMDFPLGRATGTMVMASPGRMPYPARREMFHRTNVEEPMPAYSFAVPGSPMVWLQGAIVPTLEAHGGPGEVRVLKSGRIERTQGVARVQFTSTARAGYWPWYFQTQLYADRGRLVRELGIAPMD